MTEAFRAPAPTSGGESFRTRANREITGVLVLADGTVFQGHSFGAQTAAVGEVCFNTAMTGYQEILADPS
jgi:carbamoyl-phosphate synthase small subunit